MAKVQTAKGILRTFWWMSKEDFGEMDHKLFRIVFGVVTFAAVAFFWLYFMKNLVLF